METETFNTSIERQILIGIITDAAIASSVSSIWNESDRPGLFRTSIENLIAAWSLEYYKEYNRVIKGDIRTRFQEYQNLYPNDDKVTLINDLLASLDLEAEHQAIPNRDFLIDKASKHFTTVRLERMVERVQTGIQRDRLDDSLDAIHSFCRVELGTDMGIDPLRNEDAIRQAFESTGERLIDFSEPGLDDAALFFGDTFSRDTLVGFLASEKCGKSHYLLDMAVRAVQQGKRVAYFEVGDMSQTQVMMRLIQRLSARPKKQKMIRIPERIEFDKKFNAEVSFYCKDFKKPLSADVAVKRLARFGKSLDDAFGSDIHGLLRLSCHPSGSMSVIGIESRLDAWERAGWLPDIVVIDYADILAPIDGRQEKRYQVDETWKRLRGLSQKRHLCVITASQADAASYRVKTLDKSNFSESKTKLAHVNDPMRQRRN